ncbi:hypothetical protein B0H14DRAFT_2648481 [Mycena olivaceomarginata]|nr:hypothetical protein B0H14DRAFT_2648481 [Mycena olivaceomarginata]
MSTPSSSSTRSLTGAPSTDTLLLKTSRPVTPELNSSSVVSGRPPSTHRGLGDGLGGAGPEPAGGGLDLSHDTFGVNLPLFEPLPPPRNLFSNVPSSDEGSWPATPMATHLHSEWLVPEHMTTRTSNIVYNAPDSEIILPGHTTLALSREALLSLANHHQALANAALAAAMEVAPPIAHPLNDDSLETVNVSRDDPSVAGNPDIGCNNVEPFEIGPEIPIILATKNPPHRVHLEELGFGFSLESAEVVWAMSCEALTMLAENYHQTLITTCDDPSTHIGTGYSGDHDASSCGALPSMFAGEDSSQAENTSHWGVLNIAGRTPLDVDALSAPDCLGMIGSIGKLTGSHDCLNAWVIGVRTVARLADSKSRQAVSKRLPSQTRGSKESGRTTVEIISGFQNKTSKWRQQIGTTPSRKVDCVVENNITPAIHRITVDRTSFGTKVPSARIVPIEAEKFVPCDATCSMVAFPSDQSEYLSIWYCQAEGKDEMSTRDGPTAEVAHRPMNFLGIPSALLERLDFDPGRKHNYGRLTLIFRVKNAPDESACRPDELNSIFLDGSLAAITSHTQRCIAMVLVLCCRHVDSDWAMMCARSISESRCATFSNRFTCSSEGLTRTLLLRLWMIGLKLNKPGLSGFQVMELGSSQDRDSWLCLWCSEPLASTLGAPRAWLKMVTIFIAVDGRGLIPKCLASILDSNHSFATHIQAVPPYSAGNLVLAISALHILLLTDARRFAFSPRAPVARLISGEADASHGTIRLVPNEISLRGGAIIAHNSRRALSGCSVQRTIATHHVNSFPARTENPHVPGWFKTGCDLRQCSMPSSFRIPSNCGIVRFKIDVSVQYCEHSDGVCKYCVYRARLNFIDHSLPIGGTAVSDVLEIHIGQDSRSEFSLVQFWTHPLSANWNFMRRISAYSSFDEPTCLMGNYPRLVSGIILVGLLCNYLGAQNFALSDDSFRLLSRRMEVEEGGEYRVNVEQNFANSFENYFDSPRQNREPDQHFGFVTPLDCTQNTDSSQTLCHCSVLDLDFCHPSMGFGITVIAMAIPVDDPASGLSGARKRLNADCVLNLVSGFWMLNPNNIRPEPPRLEPTCCTTAEHPEIWVSISARVDICSPYGWENNGCIICTVYAGGFAFDSELRLRPLRSWTFPSMRCYSSFSSMSINRSIHNRTKSQFTLLTAEFGPHFSGYIQALDSTSNLRVELRDKCSRPSAPAAPSLTPNAHDLLGFDVLVMPAPFLLYDFLDNCIASSAQSHHKSRRLLVGSGLPPEKVELEPQGPLLPPSIIGFPMAIGLMIFVFVFSVMALSFCHNTLSGFPGLITFDPNSCKAECTSMIAIALVPTFYLLESGDDPRTPSTTPWLNNESEFDSRATVNGDDHRNFLLPEVFQHNTEGDYLLELSQEINRRSLSINPRSCSHALRSKRLSVKGTSKLRLAHSYIQVRDAAQIGALGNTLNHILYSPPHNFVYPTVDFIPDASRSTAVLMRHLELLTLKPHRRMRNCSKDSNDLLLECEQGSPIFPEISVKGTFDREGAFALISSRVHAWNFDYTTVFLMELRNSIVQPFTYNITVILGTEKTCTETANTFAVASRTAVNDIISSHFPDCNYSTRGAPQGYTVASLIPEPRILASPIRANVLFFRVQHDESRTMAIRGPCRRPFLTAVARLSFLKGLISATVDEGCVNWNPLCWLIELNYIRGICDSVAEWLSHELNTGFGHECTRLCVAPHATGIFCRGIHCLANSQSGNEFFSPVFHAVLFSPQYKPHVKLWCCRQKRLVLHSGPSVSISLECVFDESVHLCNLVDMLCPSRAGDDGTVAPACNPWVIFILWGQTSYLHLQGVRSLYRSTCRRELVNLLCAYAPSIHEDVDMHFTIASSDRIQLSVPRLELFDEQVALDCEFKGTNPAQPSDTCNSTILLNFYSNWRRDFGPRTEGVLCSETSGIFCAGVPEIVEHLPPSRRGALCAGVLPGIWHELRPMSELLNGDVFGLNTPGSPKEGGDTQKNSNFLRAPRISYLIKPPMTAARHHVQADPNPNKVELQLSSQLPHYSTSVPVFHHDSHVRNWFCWCDWHTGPPVHSYDATSTFTSRLTGRLIAPLMYHNLKHLCDPSETMYSISVDRLSPLPLEKCRSFVEDDIAAWPRTETRASTALYCACCTGDEHLSSNPVPNVAWFVVAMNLTGRNRYPSNSSSNSVRKIGSPKVSHETIER